MKDVVIIGGMAAGCKAAARLKRLKPDYHVTIIEQRSFVSYGTCGMPLYASGDADDFFDLAKTSYGIIRTPEFFKSVKDVEVLINSKALRIDTESRTVHCRNLDLNDEFHLNYDYLVIATGAEPVMPDNLILPESDRISTFHNPLDAKRFRELAQKGKIGSSAIIGGGLIACELAEALVSLWGIETTVIEKEGHLLSTCLDKEMSLFIERKFAENEINIELSATTEKIALPIKGNPVLYLSNGKEIEVDYLFVCTGVKPSVSILYDTGILTGELGGIKVDDKMMTSIPGIYAGGDCVESLNIVTGNKSVFPLGSLANRHGRVIADNIAGIESKYPGAAGTVSMVVFNTITANTGINEKTALKLGIDYSCVWGTWSDRPDYHPNHKNIFAKMIYEKGNGKLLGLQLIGIGEVTRYIDVFSFMLMKKCTIEDLLEFEHAYNPPHSGPLTILFNLGAMALAEMNGGTECLNPYYITNDDEVFLDVREDYEASAIPLTENSINIPLSKLRNEISELDKSKKYVIICQKGSRSFEAAIILKNAGFGITGYIGGGASFKFALIDDIE
jgi:NADPH-dependent 2,4-dienoyl-CoA reductase/sulfur reductase-like enzyme/rhodanese-related sulfurtransferase